MAINWPRLIADGVKVWVAERPFTRWKEHRRRKRRLRELGIEEPTMQINLGTRTSTNAFAGGTLFSQIYVQLISLIPGEGAIEVLLLKPEAVAFAAVLFATLVARISKTPAEPGKI